jgi:hypothetical protein
MDKHDLQGSLNMFLLYSKNIIPQYIKSKQSLYIHIPPDKGHMMFFLLKAEKFL